MTARWRHVPDDLYAELKKAAKRNRRSLNQEVIAELASHSSPITGDRDLAWERATAHRKELGERVWATPQQIDRFINEGRDRRDLMMLAGMGRLPGHRDIAGDRVSANREKRSISKDHDKEVLAAFPETAVSPADFVS